MGKYIKFILVLLLTICATMFLVGCAADAYFIETRYEPAYVYPYYYHRSYSSTIIAYKPRTRYVTQSSRHHDRPEVHIVPNKPNPNNYGNHPHRSNNMGGRK